MTVDYSDSYIEEELPVARNVDPKKSTYNLQQTTILNFAFLNNKKAYFFMRIVCRQTIYIKYHALFFRKLGKMSQNLSSASVVTDT